MRSFVDQLNREVRLPGIPQRLVSLVPSQTELLVDLGLEQNLKGVTKFCVHPAHLRKTKLVVGGTKKVKLEKIEALEPDLILCNKEENTKEMVQELEKIAPVHVSDVQSIDDSLQLIEQYGRILGAEARSAEIIEGIQSEVLQFRKFMKGRPHRRAAYFIWKKPWMVAGGGTFIDHLLELNNFSNVFRQEKSRYPEIQLEELVKKKVEFVLLATEPYPFKEEDKRVFQEMNKYLQVMVVDGEYFSWYGSRLRLAFAYFRKVQDLPFS